MFERLAGISICGGYFNPECIFTPFALASPQARPRHISVIYGKNGSGKSSLANGFYEFMTDIERYSSVNLVDHSGSIIPPEDIDKCSMYVFNEDYVYKHIRFAEDGLDSVVMLGEQVELDEQINVLEADKAQFKNEIVLLTEEYSNYETHNNLLSPDFHFDKVKENLRQNWSVRESDIRSLRQNAAVKDNFINTLFDDDVVMDLALLRAEFETKMGQLRAAQLGEYINIQVALVEENSSIDSGLITALKQEISEPALSKREQQVMQVVKSYSDGEAILLRSKEVFSQENSKCPFCLQETTQEYRNELIAAITSIFETDEATKHKDDLHAISLNLISTDLGMFKPINNKLCLEIQQDILRYNNQIEEAKSKVKQKNANIYSPIVCSSFEFFSMQQNINTKLRELERERVAYNARIESIQTLKMELSDCNKKCARE